MNILLLTTDQLQRYSVNATENKYHTNLCDEFSFQKISLFKHHRELYDSGLTNTTHAYYNSWLRKI